MMSPRLQSMMIPFPAVRHPGEKLVCWAQEEEIPQSRSNLEVSDAQEHASDRWLSDLVCKHKFGSWDLSASVVNGPENEDGERKKPG